MGLFPSFSFMLMDLTSLNFDVLALALAPHTVLASCERQQTEHV